jgi:hypothetical protein
MITDPILLPIGIVCVARTEGIDQITVISAASVFVSDEECNGRTGGLAFEDTGKDFDRIGFLPLRDVAGGAGLAAVEIMLNIIDGEGQAWRTTIHDTTNRRPMALAE